MNEQYWATKHTPVVYYLSSPYGGVCKIGTTVNMTSRLHRSRTLYPAGNLYVMAHEAGNEQVEQQRFGQFRASRQNHDWYWLTPDLLTHIAILRDQHTGIPGQCDTCDIEAARAAVVLQEQFGTGS